MSHLHSRTRQRIAELFRVGGYRGGISEAELIDGLATVKGIARLAGVDRKTVQRKQIRPFTWAAVEFIRRQRLRAAWRHADAKGFNPSHLPLVTVGPYALRPHYPGRGDDDDVDLFSLIEKSGASDLASLARALKVKVPAVRKWKRNAPADHWRALETKLRRHVAQVAKQPPAVKIQPRLPQIIVAPCPLPAKLSRRRETKMERRRKFLHLLDADGVRSRQRRDAHVTSLQPLDSRAQPSR